MEISAEALGFSQEEIAQRVVEHISTLMLHRLERGEDGEDEEVASVFEVKLQERIKAQIDASIDLIAGKHVLPNITTHVEDLMLQETTRWGEKKKEPVTFIEYLTQRADAYLREEVDHGGKTKSERGSSYSSGKQTRITYLVNNHLQCSITVAMENALKIANSSIVEGIEEAVKIKLKEVQERLKVSVDTGR